MTGRLVAVEGLDGVGKTTLSVEFAQALGAVWLTTPDPALRAVRHEVDERWDPDEQSLFYAGSVLNAGRKAAMHMARGLDVVVDRYWLSTWVYARASGVKLDLSSIEQAVLCTDATLLVTACDEVRRARLEQRGCTPLDADSLGRSEVLKSEYDLAMQRPVAGHVLRVETTNSSVRSALEEVLAQLSMVPPRHPAGLQLNLFGRGTVGLHYREHSYPRRRALMGKNRGQGPTTPSTDLPAIKELLASLSGDLRALIARVSDEAVTTMVHDEVQRRIETDRTDPAPLVEQAAEGVRRAVLSELGTLATDLRARLVEIDTRSAATDARVTDARIQGAVDEATRKAALSIYRDEFEKRVHELEDAFAGYGDQFEAIRRYVDAFKPGGLPVLQQERDELARRVEVLLTERQDRDTRLGDLQARLDQLEGERRRHLLQTGIAPEEITHRLAEIEERQRDLQARETLASERDRLAQQLAELSAEVNQWRQRGVTAEEARVERQELERLRREVNEADDARVRLQDAFSRSDGDRRRLREENERLTGELMALQAAEAAAEARQQRLVALQAELNEIGRSHEQAQAGLSQSRQALLASQNEVSRLGREVDRLAMRETQLEAEWRAARATEHAEDLRAHRSTLQQWAESEAQSRAAAYLARAERAESLLVDTRQRLQDATTNLETLAGQNAKLQAEVQRLQADQSAVQASARREVELREGELEDHRTRLEQDIVLAREAAVRQALAAADVDRTLAQQDAERLTEVADQEQERYEHLHEQVLGLAQQRGELDGQLEGLRRQLGELAGRVLPSAERIAQLEQPVFRGDDLRVADTPTEAGWLREIEAGLAQAGFVFHRRLLEAFHTSLKVAHHSPLVVLAGISGTGKSELPRLYADLGGLPFLPLAVQPSWDSPHDLFGFFNYTDGRLKAEPLARLLRQTGRDEALRQSPSLVLLDEMNLARVEYYFAELLSKLETRRGVRAASDPERRNRASVWVDAGPGDEPIPLYLDERVLFVGTMNEDESTMALSDKVLDRACVLTFPAPRTMKMTEQGTVVRRRCRLSWETWISWQRDAPPSDIAEKLNAINAAMERLHRPFGHRLFRAIHAYIGNHPVPEHGWDDQFAMKIIPRLRGLECGDRNVRAGLDDLEAHVPEILSDAFSSARDREFFAWVGAPELYRAGT